MRKLMLIILSIVTLSCDGQNAQFDDYIKEFKSSDLPLIIDRQTSKSLFLYNENYKQVPESYIKGFVDPGHGNKSNCRYDFGIKLPWSRNTVAFVVQKQKFGGESSYDFDLLETILIIHNTSGEILSKYVLGKDNDGWWSSVKFDKDKVIKTQAKVLEFDKDEIDCEVIIEEFNITPNGKLELKHTIPTKKEKLIWDDTLNDFILK